MPKKFHSVLALLTSLFYISYAQAFDLKNLKSEMQSSIEKAGVSQQKENSPRLHPSPHATSATDSTDSTQAKLELKGITLGLSEEELNKLYGKALSQIQVKDQCLIDNRVTVLLCADRDCGTFAGSKVRTIRVDLENNAVLSAAFTLSIDEVQPDTINEALLAKYGKPERYNPAYYAAYASKSNAEKGPYKQFYDLNYYNDHYIGELKHKGTVFNTWRNGGGEVVVLGIDGLRTFLVVKLTSEPNLQKVEQWKNACSRKAAEAQSQRNAQEVSRRVGDL